MADFSIDQNNLPGVKEVCRDFAVLEDHCLAHNLQEQEIESHLASNVHKSRLVQQDLRVAKRLQEEEDLRAKAESKRQQRHIERFDNEMAQEIQEQLVRQAEQQRQQEEKDAAIARKLQEREMKEERKRQKQLEENFEDEYYEDQASRPPQDPRHQHPSSISPGFRKERYQDNSYSRSPYNSPDPDKKRHPNSHHGTRSRHPEYNQSDSRHLKPTEKFSEYHSPEWRPKHSEDYLKEKHLPLDVDYIEPHIRRKQDPVDNQESVVRRKPPKDYSAPREKDRHRDIERAQNRPESKERLREKDKVAGSRDRTFSGDGVPERGRQRSRTLDREMDRNEYGHESRDRGKRERHKSREKHHSRERIREREIDDHSLVPSRRCSEDSLEWDDHNNRQRLPSDVFEEPNLRGPSNDVQSPRERGRRVPGEYGMREATQGLATLDLQDQELKDMEVARMLQEEEIKASQVDKRAAQVAQDEEIARRLMEAEKREYKKSKDKEKRRGEMEYKPVQEEVVRPRTREEDYYKEEEYQRARNHKPTRPPPPTQHYENINPSYAYVESPYSPRPPSRPEAAYKGAYYRQ